MRWMVQQLDESVKDITSPVICYILPSLKCALFSEFPNDPVISIALHLLSTRARMRGGSSQENDLNSPALLPRKQIMTICIDIISMYFN